MAAAHGNSNNSLGSSSSSSSWGTDSHSLDRWLEDDLKQSSLFRQTASSKCRGKNVTADDETITMNSPDPASSLPSPTEDRPSNFEPVQRTKTAYHASTLNSLDTTNSQQLLSHNLLPLLKIYSLLASIRLHEQQQQQQQQQANYIATASKQLPPQESTSSNAIIPQIIPLVQPPSFSALHQVESNTMSSLLPSPALSIQNEITPQSNAHTGKLGRHLAGNDSFASIDTVLLKRKRNTDAARRSRLRKVLKMETLEKRAEVLKTDNEQLKVKLAVLESEVSQTTEKEKRSRQRIQELEAQLSVAHQQLVNEYQSTQQKQPVKEEE